MQSMWTQQHVRATEYSLRAEQASLVARVRSAQVIVFQFFTQTHIAGFTVEWFALEGPAAAAFVAVKGVIF